MVVAFICNYWILVDFLYVQCFNFFIFSCMNILSSMTSISKVKTHSNTSTHQAWTSRASLYTCISLVLNRNLTTYKKRCFILSLIFAYFPYFWFFFSVSLLYHMGSIHNGTRKLFLWWVLELRNLKQGEVQYGIFQFLGGGGGVPIGVWVAERMGWREKEEGVNLWRKR